MRASASLRVKHGDFFHQAQLVRASNVGGPVTSTVSLLAAWAVASASCSGGGGSSVLLVLESPLLLLVLCGSCIVVVGSLCATDAAAAVNRNVRLLRPVSGDDCGEA